MRIPWQLCKNLFEDARRGRVLTAQLLHDGSLPLDPRGDQRRRHASGPPRLLIARECRHILAGHPQDIPDRFLCRAARLVIFGRTSDSLLEVRERLLLRVEMLSAPPGAYERDSGLRIV